MGKILFAATAVILLHMSFTQYASAEMLQLTPTQVDYLGADDKVILDAVGLKRTRFYPNISDDPNDAFIFDSCTAIFHFPQGYRRYVGVRSTEVDTAPVTQIVKTYAKGGPPKPTIAANEVTIEFIEFGKREEMYLNEIKSKIPDASVECTPRKAGLLEFMSPLKDYMCNIKFETDTNSIYEFDFKLYNLGLTISKLEKTSRVCGV